MLANCLVRGLVRSIRTSKSRREKGLVRHVSFLLPPEPKRRTTDFFETAEREANDRFGRFFFFSVPSQHAEGNNSRSTFFSFLSSRPERVFLPRIHPDPEYSSVLRSVLLVILFLVLRSEDGFVGRMAHITTSYTKTNHKNTNKHNKNNHHRVT